MNSKLAIGLALPIVYFTGFIYLWIRDREIPEWDKPFSLKIVSIFGSALLIGFFGLLIAGC